jgi:hypothetical protein
MYENIQKRPVPDFPDFSVDENGMFFNEVTGHILKLTKGQSENLKVNFRIGTKIYNRSAARIVCRAFHGEPEKSDYVPNYIDGNYQNIAASNLQWTSRWYSAEYRIQLRRNGIPWIDRPIIKLSTGEIYPNSLAAAQAHTIIERYVVLAVMNKESSFGGSWWDYA